MFIIVRLNLGEHGLRDSRSHQKSLRLQERTVNRLALVLLAVAVVVLTAVISAATAGKLARLAGASYPNALLGAAAAFVTVLTLAAAIATALSELLT
ncbi:hypothetical protein ACFRKD_19650 [Streptomyces niveus]|uniref:hypothetical protein n=1 Tax=Streptomyces niveus TaxID=193462 RepID=UPI0036B8EFA5